MNNTVQNDFFLDFWLQYIQVRWANVQVIHVKFSQDVTHQKSLKLVNF